MCRHLAYLGDPVGLASPLFDAPHSLARQAEHPRHQTSGTTNPDGWGVAWYHEDRTAPEQYRTVTPIWEDTAFAARAASITAGAFVAAARLASPGAALADTGNAPFVSGPWAFSLNGIVQGFPDGIGDKLRARVQSVRREAIVGDADSEVLFALVLQELDAGADPGTALAEVVRDVVAITTGRLNLLLTDGRRIFATRYGNSLYQCATMLASEPIDERPAWSEVPDHSLVTITSAGSTTTPLPR
ncbi:MAG: gamma-glutamyl hercynylcysteine S-oxide hydrolase [Actinomycetota bacterium]|nr:gamma-glutamyl hercynylcysteine S-oxide hydrolase [Actinomycetota bacterium]